jgi:hypothetical protein
MKKINRKAKRFLLSVKILYFFNKILTIDFTGEIYTLTFFLQQKKVTKNAGSVTFFYSKKTKNAATT